MDSTEARHQQRRAGPVRRRQPPDAAFFRNPDRPAWIPRTRAAEVAGVAPRTIDRWRRLVRDHQPLLRWKQHHDGVATFPIMISTEDLARLVILPDETT